MQIKRWQSQNKTIALVPTMGNLHRGHIALVEQAMALADKVVVSIFVNPTQFDKDADLQAYPRTEQEDQQKLQKQGVDCLFLPSVETMYPTLGSACAIKVPDSLDILEGASRKGHFSGVATVVAKLFNLVKPDIAIFGEKDFQQVMLVRKLVEDLNFDIKIIAAQTVREADGLAMSSRNGYLSNDERLTASSLYKILNDLRNQVLQGDYNYSNLETEAMRKLEEAGFIPDYVVLRRQHDVQKPNKDDDALVVLAAAWLGKARLIDNIAFNISS